MPPFLLSFNLKSTIIFLYRGELEMNWQLIDTIPEQQVVDVWVKSLDNPDFGVRVCNVSKDIRHSRGWTGIEYCYITDRVFPTHWMPIPQPPVN